VLNSHRQVAIMDKEHALLDRLTSNPAHIPGDRKSPPPGNVIIYTSDRVPIFYLFRRGMEMFSKEKVVVKEELEEGEIKEDWTCSDEEDMFRVDEMLCNLPNNVTGMSVSLSSLHMLTPHPRTEQISTAIADRSLRAKAPKPHANDFRYFDYEGTKAVQQAAGRQCGIFHYGHWSHIGHRYVIETKDSLGKSASSNDHFPIFLQELAPMFAVMGSAFRVIDHQMYEQ
jgi:hypothetical protein